MLVRPPSSSKYRSQAGREFAWIEGLRQIVVRADFQTDDTVQIVTAGGQHHHRDGRLHAKAPEQVEPAKVGQHHVDQDDVVPAIHRTRQSRGRVVNGIHGEAVGLEVLLYQRAELDVVVDQQNRIHDVASIVAQGRYAPAQRFVKATASAFAFLNPPFTIHSRTTKPSSLQSLLELPTTCPMKERRLAHDPKQESAERLPLDLRARMPSDPNDGAGGRKAERRGA
ncbi:MAG TPA: hypothetical protein VKE51_38870 [Vicinamibacterales bacterium]|nr:hypothetical protein [Vicinamibacterales bacterium]